jgi:AraC-like DNA-binding protein
VERYADDKKWFFGALILACSPTLIELAHSVKPDSFMFLLVTGSLMFALKYQKEGRRRWLMTSAALAGLACSTQYTAAPAAIIVPLAWALSSKRHAPLLWLGQALLIGVVAFAAGSPYAVIDYPRFISDWSDYADLGRLKPHDAVQTGWIVAKNIWCYAGEGSLAGAAAIVGLVIGLKRNASRTLLLLIPILSYAVILSMSFDGVVPRYLLGAFPMLALLSSEGLSWISGSRTMVRALAAITVMVPGLLLSGAMDLDFLRPDTRTQATQWINEHIPQGQTLLLDQPHAGPMVVMTQQQCADLADRAEKNKSSRSRLFRAMASRHPGGGWRIYRVQRAARDLWSSPKHVAQSQADGDFLDVRPGLDVARAARIDWIVTSSFGADPRRSRELSTFFSELGAQAELVREFPFQAGAVVGPWLRVYHLKRG